eukprot:TRINITY_DN2152_c0_g1_i1.p1 TRINITY_DN2152_c0_g1~~TRINITY_DN2152_c0_g1_i1.p1  ORF type:complete len:549 (+),score=190.02 TRINITY_DN2152_c0_g1_i1:44-1690(+)
MSIWEDKENLNNADAMSISPMKHSPVPKLNLAQFGAKDRTPSPTSRKRKEPFTPSSPMNISPDRPQKKQRTGNESGIFKLPSGPLNFNSPKDEPSSAKKKRKFKSILVSKSSKLSMMLKKGSQQVLSTKQTETTEEKKDIYNVFEDMQVEKEYMKDLPSARGTKKEKRPTLRTYHSLSQISSSKPEKMVIIVPRPSPGAQLFTNIVRPSQGWTLELGDMAALLGQSITVEPHPPHARNFTNHFWQKPHQNFIGQDPRQGPVVVSVIQSDGTGRAIVRTGTGEARLEGPVRPGVVKGRSFRPVLKALRPDIDVKLLTRVKDQQLANELKKYEDDQLITKFKFGVLYVREGQTHEDDMFANSEPSVQFFEFLSLLGDRVALKGFLGYTGGLDVTRNATGTHSFYTKWNELEVMFHVAPMLPYNASDRQQLERKRHLGNDIVVIVFVDGTSTYDPSTIKSHFNHVVFIVQPELSGGVTRYKIQVARKSSVPEFGPSLVYPPIFERGLSFRNFLLTKLVNAERAAYEADELRTKLNRTREGFLTYWNQTYGK